MKTAALAFASSTVAAAALTPAVRALAHRWGALDHALTSRKIHGKPIPRLGGIAIVIAFYAPLLALLFVNSDVGHRFYADPSRALAFILGGLGIAALGIYDDLRGANAKVKFAVQFAVAGLVYALGFRIDSIANPFGPDIQLGFLGLPFTLLWIAGVINALNLIDGLDGLAGGVAFIAIAITFVLAAHRAEPLMLLITGAIGGAVLGFLFYNFNPASIFMGDTGSMFLGFVLATTAIPTNQKSSTTVTILVPIIALGLPIADTLLAMGRRAARGAPLFSADRGHIHHKLLDLGLSHRDTVLVLYGASALLGMSALAIAYATPSQTTYFVLALGGLVYVGLRGLGFVNLGDAPRILEERKRNLEMRGGIRRIGTMMREARSLADVWAALRRATMVLEARAVALHLPDEDPIADGFDVIGIELLRARYSVLPERPGDTHLELAWDDGRTHVDRDTEIAIELLCEQLAGALDRLIQPEPVRAGLARVVNFRR